MMPMMLAAIAADRPFISNSLDVPSNVTRRAVHGILVELGNFDVEPGVGGLPLEGRMTGCTGDAAVAETMVMPYRHGNLTKIAKFKAFFGLDGFLTVPAYTAQTFDLAAQLAGTQGMRLIDALHYATAIQLGCRFLVTNDGASKAATRSRGFMSRLCKLEPESTSWKWLRGFLMCWSKSAAFPTWKIARRFKF